jgi:hypothetical protein
MAVSNINAALAFTLRWEGGYSNHPRDPGRATMKGITQATYDGFRKRRGLSVQPVGKILESELQTIYRRQYWDAVRGDDLPAGLDLAVFDFAVNSGMPCAAKFLQRVLGITVDGIIGEATLGAAHAAKAETVVAALCDARLAWLKTLTTWRDFGSGWSSRIVACRTASQALARGVEIAAPMTAVTMTGKALARDQSLPKTTTGMGAMASSAGTVGSLLTAAAEQIKPLGDIAVGFQVLFGVVLVAGVACTLIGAVRTVRSQENLA